MQPLTRNDVRMLRSLKTRKGRCERGTFLVEGEKGVREALAASWPVQRIVVLPGLAAEFASSGVEVVVSDQESMRKISGVETPPGVIAEATIPQPSFPLGLEGGLVIVCCGIADPGNLGTVIRTADWFGVKTVVVSEDSVDPFNEKVVRSSMGSIFHTTVIQADSVADVLRNAKEAGFALVTTQIKGESVAWPARPICLLLGSESHGVPDEYSRLADSAVSIPGSGNAESLNVGVSCGILLYDHYIKS